MLKFKLIIVSICSLFLIQVHADSFDEAQIAYKNKNYIEAKNLFEKHLNENPRDANANYNLGVCLVKQNKVVEAIWYFEKTYKLNPGHAEAQIQLNACYKKLNFIDSWQAPIGILKAKFFKISSQKITLLLFVFTLCAGICIFLLMRKKGSRKVFQPLLILSLVIFVVITFLAIQKSQFQWKATSAIVTEPIETVWLSEKGNALIELKLNAGERVEIVNSTSRIEIVLASREHVWLDPSKLKIIQ